MSLLLRFQVLACLLLPAIGLAMEPLPRANSSAGSDTITVPLDGLLNDYVNLLPFQVSLSSLADDGSLRSWSVHRDSLQRACQAAPSVCAPLLKAQFDMLFREWQKWIKASLQRGMSLRDVIVVTAMTDLCQLRVPEMGTRCLDQNVPTYASVGWRRLGYEHLFLAFSDIDLDDRNQKRNWLEQDAEISSADRESGLKQLERDMGARERDAHAFELRDMVSGAYSQWVYMLMDHASQTRYEGLLTALANLARLDALQGQAARSEQWWQLGQRLLIERPDLKASGQCLLQSFRFGMDVENHTALILQEGPQRLQGLIDQDCAFTAQAIQFALLAIKHDQPTQALDVLQRAQSACERMDGCGYDRRRQIKALVAMTQRQPDALMRELQYWQGRLKLGVLLAAERQIIWALADLLRSTGARAEAAAIYQALDEQIALSRSSKISDLSHYDELKRIRVRSNVEQGIQIPPMQTESLRGQGLLRNLRTQRWFKELAGENDPVARDEMDRQLADIRTKRQSMEMALSKIQSSTDSVPLLVTIIGTAGESIRWVFDDLEKHIRETYLGKLVVKKEKNAWSTPLQALMWRELDENSADESPFAKHTLDESEAYLSWLRVPGGYVATLLAVDPRDHGPMTLPRRPRLIKQTFMAFSPQDEAMLELYRDLLQSGAGIKRGAKVTQPIESDRAGLMLNGQPIWQQMDGRFTVGLAQPAGALRIKDFGSLSDALFERLLAPFSEHYQDAQRLVISPDGALAYLPFETLTRRGVSVLETVDIGYVQSLAVYAELKKRSATKARESLSSLLSVADPKYLPSGKAGTDARSKPLQRLETMSWQALPGTRKESDAISRLYRDKLQLLGPQASKTTLLKMQNQKALDGYQILHFATHGYVDDERSALVLSAEPSQANTYLMDEDIVGWNLNSDLVLLSACNTGMGRQQKGEGVVGLPYAFFMAGNINTLMSLWPVDDEGTATLMPAFMQRIQKGEDHVTALNNTKRAFARGDFGQALRNPRVWSAFVLYGVPLAGGL